MPAKNTKNDKPEAEQPEAEEKAEKVSPKVDRTGAQEAFGYHQAMAAAAAAKKD